jgi:hypothetical protein
MQRRRLIKSLGALLCGGSAAAAAESKPSISKNSTRCEASERGRTEATDSVEGPAALRRGSSTAPIQT